MEIRPPESQEKHGKLRPEANLLEATSSKGHFYERSKKLLGALALLVTRSFLGL